MSPSPPLGDLQLAILRILWSRGEASASDVHSALKRDLAPTTVSTMLAKMEKRGLVRHRTEGRRFLYEATLSETETHEKLVGNLVEKLYSGDPAGLVNHLLKYAEIDPDELVRLRSLISKKLKDARSEA